LKSFRDDPEANPLGTPSGKIEVFSETLQNLNNTWELGEDEVIFPIPLFDPGFEGYGSVTAEFPLYCSGFHHKSSTHSSFGFIEELKDVSLKFRGSSNQRILRLKDGRPPEPLAGRHA
jgi:anaerobic selenocysteine-containing dehydrogenase